MVNTYSTCIACGYDINSENIINKNNYYSIITEKTYPKFIFLLLEFNSEKCEEFKN